MLKLVFAGTPDVAVPSLRAFAADSRFDVVGVITRPDAPTGRGRRLMPSPVKAAALELGIPVIDLKPRSPEFLDALSACDADIAAVIAYGNILPKPVLDAVPLGWYNLHFSNLPKWRGAAPVQRAIWAGDPTTGADVFKVGEGLDDGPIVSSLTVELTGRETSGELLDRLAQEGAPMYVDALAAVGDGTATLTPQSAENVEYAHKITVENARIDWTDSADAIDRQIRACAPNPGAWTELHTGGDTPKTAGKPGTGGGDGAITLHVLAAQPVKQTANQPSEQSTEQPTAQPAEQPAAQPASQPAEQPVEQPVGHPTYQPVDSANTNNSMNTNNAGNSNNAENLAPGELKISKKNVWVGTGTAALELLQVKAQGKKAMRAADWARGARLPLQAHVR